MSTAGARDLLTVAQVPCAAVGDALLHLVLPPSGQQSEGAVQPKPEMQLRQVPVASLGLALLHLSPPSSLQGATWEWEAGAYV